MSGSLLVTLHTAISMIALLLGIPAVAGLVSRRPAKRWTAWFLGFAVATSATGFLFPFIGVTPAFAVGIVACAILAVTLAARYAYHLSGSWRSVHALGVLASQYLLVFVTIAQAFDKVPGLMVLAPTGSGPVFALAQAVALAVFVALGWLVLRRRGHRRAV